MAFTNTSFTAKPVTLIWSPTHSLRHKVSRVPSTICRTRHNLVVHSMVNEPAAVDRSAPRLDDLPIPNGSFGWPIIGNTIAIMRNARGHSAECLKKYGKIYKTSLFGKKAVVIFGVENVQEVMTGAASRNISCRFKGTAEKLCPEALLQKDGDDHIRLRKLVSPFFTAKAAASYLPFVVETANAFCERFAARGSFSFLNEMKHYAFSVNTAAVLGITFTEESTEEMLDLFKIYGKGFSSLGINLPFTKFGKAMRARTALIEIIDEAVNLMKSIPEDSPQASKALKKVVDARDENGGSLTQGEIRDLMLLILFAGFDTTSQTMASIVFELAHQPEVWDKLRAEQQQIIESFGNAITPEALDAMSYTEAVVRETMRFKVLADFVLRRVAKPFELGGYRIPEGWMVHVQTGGTTRLLDERWMTDADEFRPERFLEKGATKGAYMPFGLGPHSCLGKVIAVVEMTVLLAVIARKYRVIVENPDAELAGTSRVIPADGVPVRVEKLSEPVVH